MITMLLAGCFPSQPGSATGSLKGSLVTMTGSPVPDARIAVGGIATQTTREGRFYFGALPAGELEVAIGSSEPNAFDIDELTDGQSNNLTIALDSQGNLIEAQMTRVGGTTSRGEAIHRLRPPSGAPDPDAHGKVEVEEESSGDEEFEVKISHLAHRTIFDVYLQHDPADLNSMQLIGSITTNHDGKGKLELETEDGESLPFGLHLAELFGRRVEVRGHGVPTVYLEGTVPPGVPSMGRTHREGEIDLTNVGAPAGAEGEVEIESTPREEDEEFEVEVEDADPNATYLVCVECGPPAVNAAPVLPPAFTWSRAAGDDQTSAIEATLSFPHVTAAPNAVVEIPIKVQTADDMTFMSFVIEYSSAHMHFLGSAPGVDAAVAGFTDIAVNTNLPFAPAVLDSHLIVQVSNPSGLGTLQGMNAVLEIVRLRFTVGNLPGTTAPILWDRSLPAGLPRTFLEVVPNRTLTGEDPLAFIDGSITITGGTPEFDCVGFIHTDDEGEGELELHTSKGARLPCGVQYVEELQYLAGGDRQIVVHLNDENGPIVFRGRLPRFGEDNDDDDDDHHDDLRIDSTSRSTAGAR